MKDTAFPTVTKAGAKSFPTAASASCQKKIGKVKVNLLVLNEKL